MHASVFRSCLAQGGTFQSKLSRPIKAFASRDVNLGYFLTSTAQSAA